MCRDVAALLYIAVLLAAALHTVSGQTASPGEGTSHSRKLAQTPNTEPYELYVVYDFGQMYNAAILANDPIKRIHVVVNNHIIANGRSLGAGIRGKLRITGNCTNLSKIPTPNHNTLTNLYTQDISKMCQLFLNELAASSPAYSLSPTQDRSLMSGQSFIRGEPSSEIYLQDLEFAGCYSVASGGCVSSAGGFLEAERVGIAAAFSAAAGGGFYITEATATYPATLNLLYVSFWETTATVAGDEVYYYGEPTDLSVVPVTMDQSHWNIVSTNTNPPAPPTPGPDIIVVAPPPPPSPPSPPPPPVPGNYFEYEAEVAGPSWLDENRQLVIYIAAPAAAAVFLCILSTLVLHYLIVNRLWMFEVPDNHKSTAGKLIRGHTRMMLAGESMKQKSVMSMKRSKSRMSKMSMRGLSRMSFKRTKAEKTLSDPNAGVAKKSLAAQQMKGNVMTTSTRRLAAKLEQITSHAGQAMEYKKVTAERGTAAGALPVVFQPPQAPKAKSQGDLRDGQQARSPNPFGPGQVSNPQPIKGVWGPPSMGAVYSQLPKGNRAAGPLEQRRQQKEAAAGAQADSTSAEEPTESQKKRSKGLRWENEDA